MTKVIILKSTIAKKKRVIAGSIIDIDAAEASFLVSIKKAKYFEGNSIEEVKAAPQSETSSVEAPKKRRGRPAKNEERSTT